jgi:uncharacterized membrane protein
MVSVLALLACIGAATVGGVFFAFSTFVMKALAQLPTSQGAAACLVAAFFPWGAPRSALLLAAGLLYLVGSFAVTLAFNVPRNERLVRLVAESPEARWLHWNHARTAASLASAACSAATLVC